MLNPQALKPGEEQHEAFTSHIGRNRARVHGGEIPQGSNPHRSTYLKGVN